MAWQTRPYELGYSVADLAWYCSAYGVEGGATRLETMRRLVLYLAAQEPQEKEQRAHARTA